MGQREQIISLLQKNTAMMQRELAESIYGDDKHSPNIHEALTKLVKNGIVSRSPGKPAYYSLTGTDFVMPEVQPKQQRTSKRRKALPPIPTPTSTEVERYLGKWEKLENYREQEKALNTLFLEVFPHNTDLHEILIKAAALNNFYSTHVFGIYRMAQRILELNIDEAVRQGDAGLVDKIRQGNKDFYSFATKYCSRYNPSAYPIYDSYVEKVLMHFKKLDGFANFRKEGLKNYAEFKRVLLAFRNYYSLTQYTVKQLDHYLWQLGKEYYPKETKKKTKSGAAS